MTPLHAHAQYICIVYGKYQKDSVKALVQVDFPMYSLSKQKQKKQTGEMAKFTKLSFCQTLIFGIKLLHANVQCVYIMKAKYQIASVKALVQVDFPGMQYLSTNKPL